MSAPITGKSKTCQGCVSSSCASCFPDVEGYLVHYKSSSPDPVKQPSHYMICDTEAIDIIQMALSVEEYKGYLFGNVLKYRLRAGKKDSTEQDINKALRYEEMYRKAFGEMPH